MGTVAALVAHTGGFEITTRQLEVLKLVALGNSTQEIAAQLSISARTAQWHISRLMQMFEVPNRAALVHAAAAWLPPSPYRHLTVVSLSR